MKKVFFSVFVSFIINSFGFAQTYNSLDSLCKHLLKKYNLPGIALVAVKENKTVFKSTYGKANAEMALSDTSRLYIASITKSFTALCIAILAQEGKLSYDEPISLHIPKRYFPDEINPDSILIRDLLTHTHGLSNDPMVFRTAYSGDYPKDLKELIKFTQYRSGAPDDRFKYNNLGYLLAGIIVEEVSGKNWRKFMTEEVLIPLKLTSSTTRYTFNPELEALPYEFFSGNSLDSRKSDATLHSAGGIYSTLTDIENWLKVFTARNQEPLCETARAMLQNDYVKVGEQFGPFSMNTYGNGWIGGDLMGINLKYHFGSYPGYESIISFNPDRNSGIFVFVNERLGGQRIAAMITAYFYLIETEMPNANQTIERFYQFIDPVYNKNYDEPQLPIKSEKFFLQTGTYFNDAYGKLTVSMLDNKYIFTIGSMSAIATIHAEQPDLISIEWTSGIKEEFTYVPENSELIYGDFGSFKRKP